MGKKLIIAIVAGVALVLGIWLLVTLLRDTDPDTVVRFGAILPMTGTAAKELSPRHRPMFGMSKWLC